MWGKGVFHHAVERALTCSRGVEVFVFVKLNGFYCRGKVIVYILLWGLLYCGAGVVTIPRNLSVSAQNVFTACIQATGEALRCTI